MTSRIGRLAMPLALFTSAVPAAAAEGRLGGGESIGVSLWRIVLALLVCIMLALVAALALRRSGFQVRRGSTAGGGNAGMVRRLLGRLPLRHAAIDVVETRRLSQHADLTLVRHGGREYLLLLFAGGSRLLRASPVAPPEPADPQCD
jgi:hypothetical protein